MKRHRTDRLIDVAAAILREIGRPATAQEIVDRARADVRFEAYINGKTPHKTLNARIATDIVLHGTRSAFFRYAPSAYGLRESLRDGRYASGYRKVFIGTQRRKQVANEDVAVVPREQLSLFRTDGLYGAADFPLSLLELLSVSYVDRRSAEKRSDIVQLVSYAYLQHDDCVLAFERGSFTSDDGEFVGKQSIGFGGHLNHDDLSLFDDSTVGFYSNVMRELHEELYMFRPQLQGNREQIRFLGFLVDSTTGNGKKHLGLAARIELRDRIELESPTLGIRNLRWISLRNTPNSFHQYEIWSQYLFRHIQAAGDA